MKKSTTETRRHGERQFQSYLVKVQQEELGPFVESQTECSHGNILADRAISDGNKSVIPINTTPKFRFSPCLRASVVDFCLRAIRTFNATLREIFDESAYDRFLQRTGTSHCKDSYRAFMRDRESAMAQKPRCC